MERHCYLRNIQDLLSDGKTPHERLFVMPLNGPVTVISLYFCERVICFARYVPWICVSRGERVVRRRVVEMCLPDGHA